MTEVSDSVCKNTTESGLGSMGDSQVLWSDSVSVSEPAMIVHVPEPLRFFGWV